MTEPPNKIGRQRSLYIVGLWICALAPATLVTITVQSFKSDLRSGAVILVFVVSWVGSSFAGHWAMFERTAELRKKYPTSSKELRRKTKEFYDSLPR